MTDSSTFLRNFSQCNLEPQNDKRFCYVWPLLPILNVNKQKRDIPSLLHHQNNNNKQSLPISHSPFHSLAHFLMTQCEIFSFLYENYAF